MKANQSPKDRKAFGMDDEGVSPVIAVILMVAITVVLAATVFVLVSDIGGQSGRTAIPIGFSASEANDRLTVTSAGQGADWSRIALTGPDDLRVALDADPVAADTLDEFDEEGLVQAAHYLQFCWHVAGGSDGNVNVIIRDTEANQIVFEHTFMSVDVCGYVV